MPIPEYAAGVKDHNAMNAFIQPCLYILDQPFNCTNLTLDAYVSDAN